MDLENRQYRPLDMQRFHQGVNFSQLCWSIAVGILFFTLTCVGEPAARKTTKNGSPIITAVRPQ